MNTISNSGRSVAAGLCLALLAFLGLAAAGCSDTGPVNLFAPELFNKHPAGPNLAFYSASSISFTTEAPTPGCNVCYSGYPAVYDGFELVVTVANNGGSGTYGPVCVTFTSSDCHVVWEWAGAGSSAASGAWQNPPSTSENYATAVSSFGSGNQILPFNGTAVLLYQGYDNAGDLVDDNQGLSAAFYYTPNTNPGGIPYDNATITVPITLGITDGDAQNNTFSSTFDIYITQSNGNNVAADNYGNVSTACPSPPNW